MSLLALLVLTNILGIAAVFVVLSVVNFGLWQWFNLLLLLMVVLSIGICLRKWHAVFSDISCLRRRVREMFSVSASSPLALSSCADFDALAGDINRLSRTFAKKLSSLEELSKQQNDIFASMSEGIIAVSADGRVISINNAARNLLDIETKNCSGLTLEEFVRSSEIHAAAQAVLEGKLALEREFQLVGKSSRWLGVGATALRDSAGRGIGVVLMLNDITERKRVDDIRRDFVANVSHELRTPVTAIIGFVETLLDGAWQNPEDSKRFLIIVKRHADRLHQIITELLNLASVELQGEKQNIIKEELRFGDIVATVESVCGARLQEKQLALITNGLNESTLLGNRVLLEQAVVNLVDNAIKYTEFGGTIQLKLKSDQLRNQIVVEDSGVGISNEHLPRLFERFYRVDKGRSRKEGGTGLGLTIVKHVALAHGGEVKAESELGLGSKFSISLPA